MSSELSDKFFGGTSEVKKKLVSALKEDRQRQGKLPGVIDTRCLRGIETPRCREYEANPELLTPLTFSLVSSYLGLTLDRALPVDLSKPEDMKYVVKHMKKSGAYVVGVSPEEVTAEAMAPVYLLLKIMEEIEQDSSKKVA